MCKPWKANGAKDKDPYSQKKRDTLDEMEIEEAKLMNFGPDQVSTEENDE